MANLVETTQQYEPSKITDEENKLILAIKEKRLINATEDELKQCLRFIYVLIGLKNIPGGELKIFLHEFIRQNYGGHTAAEIRLAFEMAITGKLDVDPVCYENFSPLYFASIMNAFRSWSKAAVQKIEWKVVEEKPKTKDQIVDINCEYALYLFKQVDKLPKIRRKKC